MLTGYVLLAAAVPFVRCEGSLVEGGRGRRLEGGEMAELNGRKHESVTDEAIGGDGMAQTSDALHVL